jgi:chemotaxis protein methyltransferase WspC
MSQPDFESLLREAIGLDPDTIGSNTLHRAVKVRMTTLGIPSIQRYWEYLEGSSGELQELVEAVVVPETWFFRDREAFGAMSRQLKSSFFSASADSQIRILSVPCCTGEEPYSIAITLLEAGMFGNRFAIDAVDVSRSAIVRAKRGVYGTNSFRGDDLGFRGRYMEREGDRYRIRQDIRHAVRFYQDNLFAGSFRGDSAPYDVIFCRNLLIYFDTGKQALALEKLKRLLKPNGSLFVGPAEAVLASRNGFQPLNEVMSFAFKKEPMPVASITGFRMPQPKRAVLPEQRLSSPASTSMGTVTAIAAEFSAKPKTQVDISQIQSLADAGQFEQALALCQGFFHENVATAEVCYLRGLIHDAMNETADAVKWYRKTVYLEPAHSEALLHLALHYERQNNPTAAARLRQRAKRAVVTNGGEMNGKAAQGKNK